MSFMHKTMIKLAEYCINKHTRSNMFKSQDNLESNIWEIVDWKSSLRLKVSLFDWEMALSDHLGFFLNRELVFKYVMYTLSVAGWC